MDLDDYADAVSHDISRMKDCRREALDACVWWSGVQAEVAPLAAKIAAGARQFHNLDMDFGAMSMDADKLQKQVAEIITESLLDQLGRDVRRACETGEWRT